MLEQIIKKIYKGAVVLSALGIFGYSSNALAQNKINESKGTFNVGVSVKDGKYNTQGIHNPVDSAKVTIKDVADTTKVFSDYTNSSGYCQIPVTTTSAVGEDGDEDEISGFELGQNYPNPFNPSTIFNYTLGKSGNVRTIIYNILGQKVRDLFNDVQERGSYSAEWDGKDNTGKATSSGVYFYALQTENFKDVKKMVRTGHGCEEAVANVIINENRMNSLRANKNSEIQFSNMFEIKTEKENYSFEPDTVTIVSDTSFSFYGNRGPKINGIIPDTIINAGDTLIIPVNVSNDDSTIFVSDPRIIINGNSIKWIPTSADSIIAKVYANDAYNSELKDSSNVFKWKAKEIETGFTLNGRIINYSENGVDNALVKLINKTTNDTTKIFTDSDGNYNFNNLTGTYDLIVKKTGYWYTIKRDLSVDSNKTFNLDMMDTVFVTADGDTVLTNPDELWDLYGPNIYWFSLPIPVFLTGFATHDDSVAAENFLGSLNPTKTANESPVTSVEYRTGLNFYVGVHDSIDVHGYGIVIRKGDYVTATAIFPDMNNPGYLRFAMCSINNDNMQENWMQHEAAGFGIGKDYVETFLSNMIMSYPPPYTNKDVGYTMIAEKHKEFFKNNKTNTTIFDWHSSEKEINK